MSDQNKPTAEAETKAKAAAQAKAEKAAALNTRLSQPKDETDRLRGGKYIVLHTAVDSYREGDEVDFEDLDAKQIQRLVDLGAVAETSKLSLDQRVTLRDHGFKEFGA